MGLTCRPKSVGLYQHEYEKDACGVGFIAHIKGQASHQILRDASQILCKMEHRGASGAEVNTGDGAGVLTALPVKFLKKVAQSVNINLDEEAQSWACGIFFLPKNPEPRTLIQKKFEEFTLALGLKLLGWRDVPQNPEGLGPTALASEPFMSMPFIASSEKLSEEELDRRLWALRKYATHQIRGSNLDLNNTFYIASLSSRILVYKGMLTPDQLFNYFPDLSDPDYETHLAMVHSRFSTNTFPSWDRAQPLRYMAHNGEINTLRGNLNKMWAREGLLSSPVLGELLQKARPIAEPDQSDSGYFDNVLELLTMAGRSLPQAVMMMIPEAWQNNQHMDKSKKSFYRYHAHLMEPWDGPASVAFTDGRVIGAVLDRNGLRPSRITITKDDRVIMASEVGVLNIDPKLVLKKTRLQPGKMFLVDFSQGRIVGDEELKHAMANTQPYEDWIKNHEVHLSEFKHAGNDTPASYNQEELLSRLRAFGYTQEHLEVILRSMAELGQEALGSMGNDAALAVLSQKPRLIYDYFKQLFAQVTNPPIDSIREEIVMSLECAIGPEKNLLEATPEHCARLILPVPFLSNEQFHSLKYSSRPGWKTAIIDITFEVGGGYEAFMGAIQRIRQEAVEAIQQGYKLICLTDRPCDQNRAPLPALIAVGAVHHHLIKNYLRSKVGLLVESGEPREPHHFCALLGYGADAINPYLAFESIYFLNEEGLLDKKLNRSEIVSQFFKALTKATKKIMGKMGISTLESYKGAQIFEIVGLDQEVVETCFRGTTSRIKGSNFKALAEEVLTRHAYGWPSGNDALYNRFINPGDIHYRFDGEKHMWDPTSIALLQRATRQNEYHTFKKFSEHQNQRSQQQATLRGLLKFKTPLQPIPLEEVESVESLVKRFATGAMSYGSISKETHETLAIAMNRLGGKSNTGEGGEDPIRFKPLTNGDSKRSAIKQVASARFGVTIEYLANAVELQIKMAQGAKPGEGGELPGHKVVGEIAKTRYATPGVGLISPPPHHDIYSIEDLAQLIFDLKNANPTARISVKLVSEVGVGTVAAGVAKGHADHILISGHDGGTGASPITGIKHAGLPWELGLAETHQTLVLNNLRSRVVIQTDGQLKTGHDVAIAALLGAEEFGFSTAPLITLGCIMMRKCHMNTCPVGVATQDPALRAKFNGKPEYVERFFRFIAQELREIMASLGFRTLNEMVGRVDLLEVDEAVLHWKSKGLDLSPLLMPAAQLNPNSDLYCTQKQDHGLDKVLDNKLIEACQKAIEEKEPVILNYRITNRDRTTGTMLSYHIAKKWGNAGLPDNTIRVHFEGSAGQSFGAWLAHGVSFFLEGEANDYVGKGLSGGILSIYPPRTADFNPRENVIIGNVAFYGATGGEAYIRGLAAERFCVRNSGARVVVEGVGDHGCEYMTGGRAVILGPTGRNFAAGMSGGIAWVYDPNEKLPLNLNKELVELEPLTQEDFDEVRLMIEKHQKYTDSDLAKEILLDWANTSLSFVKVMPKDYKRVLESLKQTQENKVVVHG